MHQVGKNHCDPEIDWSKVGGQFQQVHQVLEPNNSLCKCVCVWVGGGFAHIAKKTHHLDKQVHLPQFFPFAFLFGVMGPSSNTLNFKWMFHPINVSGVFSASWRKEFTGQRHKCLTLQQNRSRWRHSSPEINKMRWSQQMDDISWR